MFNNLQSNNKTGVDKNKEVNNTTIYEVGPLSNAEGLLSWES